MENIESINKENYIDLRNKYGNEQIINYLKQIVKSKENEYRQLNQEEQNKMLYEMQLELWDRYGYCFSVLHYYPFYSIIVEKIKELEKNNTYADKLNIEEEVQYAFQLLAKNYITFLDKNNKLDIKRIFSKAKSQETKKEIIKLLQNFYRNYQYESYYDKSVKEMMVSEQQKTNNSSESKKIEEELINEVKLYLDYRIAKYKFFIHNKGLIGYTSKVSHADSKVEEDDLYQEGIFGLDSATELFDIRKGNKFATYAFYWIKRVIQYEVMRNLTIDIPFYLNNKYNKITRKEEEYIKKYGEIPTLKELSILTELSEEEILDTKAKVAITRTTSIDQPIITNDGEDICTIQESIPDEKAEFEDEVIDSEMIKQILDFLSKELSPREYQILLLKSGIGIDKPMTLKEIGNLLGITHQRVQQIYVKVIGNLQKSSKVKKLNPYK